MLSSNDVLHVNLVHQLKGITRNPSIYDYIHTINTSVISDFPVKNYETKSSEAIFGHSVA